jgi:hypothetical protein
MNKAIYAAHAVLGFSLVTSVLVRCPRQPRTVVHLRRKQQLTTPTAGRAVAGCGRRRR